MRILHISDLHVSPPSRLPDAWAPVDACLHPDDMFDFVVVSGDLSERAQPSEFDTLETLVTTDVMRRLRVQDRARIVFVPGNHDVLWDDAHFKPVEQGHAAAVESIRKDPHLSNFRAEMTDGGTLRLWEIKEDEYARRLVNVQSFLDRFYGDSLDAEPCKKLMLPNPGEDWSCHPFLEQGIAFVGLNSCDRNDKHWHGAGFESRAIEAATRRIRDLRALHPNLLVVAVWHHGFASDRARPDRLDLEDVGRLYNMGVRLGLHGHTHLAGTQYHELIGGALRILATGSLAAGRSGLPDRTPNQFSILELGLGVTQVRVETWRLNYHRQYERTPARTYALANAAGSRNHDMAQRSVCRLHRRVCKINADGVKHVSIEMQELAPFGRVQLALVMPPYGASSTREPPLFDNEPQELADKYLPGGKHRYTAELKPKVGDLTWQYDVSNSVALSHEDLLLLPSRAETYPNIRQNDEDACAFVPTFACETLELEARFERAPPFRSARALVERRADHGSGADWEVDSDETERAQAHFVSGRNAEDHNVLSLKLKHPLVEHRYSLVFAPGADGRTYPSQAKFIAKDVLKACRDEPFSLSKLRADLTLAVGDALSQQLGGAVGHWVAHLWHADARILLAAFGEFPSFDWSSQFEAGSGIAGHAFRHCAVVGWCNDAPGLTQTVYRPSRPLPGQHVPEHQWVLCLPLRVSPRGAAVGVVGLARPESKTAVDRRCEDYVRGLADHPQGSPELLELVAVVNLAFWTALTPSLVLTTGQRRYASARLEEWQLPTSPSPQP